MDVPELIESKRLYIQIHRSAGVSTRRTYVDIFPNDTFAIVRLALMEFLSEDFWFTFHGVRVSKKQETYKHVWWFADRGADEIPVVAVHGRSNRPWMQV